MKLGFAQRKDLMSLQTIKKQEIYDRDPLQIIPRKSMNLNDIEGCRTYLPGYKYN